MFSLLRVRFFSAAGQVLFPFYLSFDQVLIRCFPTLHNLLWRELPQFLRGILGSIRGMTFMAQRCWNNKIALMLHKDTHLQKVVDTATGSGRKLHFGGIHKCILKLSALRTVINNLNLASFIWLLRSEDRINIDWTKISCVVSTFIHLNRIVSGWNGLTNTKATSINKPQPFGWLPGVRATLASAFQSRTIAFQWMKIEKVVLIQTNRSFDLSGPIKLAKFRVFIY